MRLKGKLVGNVCRLGFVILGLVSTSCGPAQSRSSGPGPYEFTHLTEVLKPGAPASVVTQNFGAPLSTRVVNPIESWLTYDSLSSVAQLKTSNHVIGFEVLIRSNVVVKWTPVRTNYDKFD
jgi:hypothetical protein